MADSGVLRVDAGLLTLRRELLPAEKVPSGSPAVCTGSAVITPDCFGMAVGAWEHEVGVSTDEEIDEVFVVVSGRGRIVLSGAARPVELAPGVVVALKAGMITRWEIYEPLRKVSFVQTRPAGPGVAKL